jgi:hypothetical protein
VKSRFVRPSALPSVSDAEDENAARIGVSLLPLNLASWASDVGALRLVLTLFGWGAGVAARMAARTAIRGT